MLPGQRRGGCSPGAVAVTEGWAILKHMVTATSSEVMSRGLWRDWEEGQEQ